MVEFEKIKKIREHTVMRNLLCQYVFFPLLFTAFVIVPLGIYAFVNVFISEYTRDNLANAIVFGVVSIAIAFVCGLILGIRVKNVPAKNAAAIRLLSLTPLAINTAALSIAYFSGGLEAAKVAAYVVNPLFILDNLLLESILENSIVLVMILVSIAYTVTFLAFSRNEFPQTKKNNKIFVILTTIVATLALASCTYSSYPEFEYEILKHKYDSLTFSDEMDYDFYNNLPFDKNSNLVKTGGLELDYSDVFTTPRLDGATAFYPVYAAIAENCYSGLKTEAENNDWQYFNDMWAKFGDGDNIGLYNNGINTNSEVFNRCAELLSCTQTTRAYDGLADGKSDVVFAFEPSEAQIAYAAKKGVEFELTPIGYDAFCFFVNVENPVNGLSLKEVQDIYSGNTTNWKKVGGKNKRIFAFTRPENSGSQTIMENSVMNGVKINTRFQAKVIKTMGAIIHVVDGYLNTPAAIGYTFMYYSSFMVTGKSIKYLAIDGIAPTAETVRSCEYQFSTPFYAVTAKGKETPETLRLIDWLTGEQGQSLIEKCGYVGV